MSDGSSLKSFYPKLLGKFTFSITVRNNNNVSSKGTSSLAYASDCVKSHILPMPMFSLQRMAIEQGSKAIYKHPRNNTTSNSTFHMAVDHTEGFQRTQEQIDYLEARQAASRLEPCNLLHLHISSDRIQRNSDDFSEERLP